MNRIVESDRAASPFDSAACDYDLEFTVSPLGRDLRAIVWDRLAARFKAGDRILELNCGTGEDAVWMAKRGIRVLASDISDEMLTLTVRKAAANSLAHMIEVRRLDIARPDALLPGERFEGVLSNFGGLNCTADLGPLARVLTDRVVPGGALVLVLMGRHCAWETAWHCLHLQPATAVRRMQSGGVEAKLHGHTLRVWYPSIRSVRRVFTPGFVAERVTGLGVFLPPTYLARVVESRPHLYRWLGRLERMLAARFPFNASGDHIIFEFRRTGETPSHGI